MSLHLNYKVIFLEEGLQLLELTDDDFWVQREARMNKVFIDIKRTIELRDDQAADNDQLNVRPEGYPGICK